MFFRGFLYNILSRDLGNDFGLTISSAIFGLAHFPVFGANAAVEAILGIFALPTVEYIDSFNIILCICRHSSGGLFGFAYEFSGRNLLVPVIVHYLYDVVTMMILWISATEELKYASNF